MARTRADNHRSGGSSGSPAPAAGRHPYRAFILRLLAGLALLLFLLWRYDLSTVATVLTRESPWYFLLAVMVYVAGQVMSAYRWQLLGALAGIQSRFREYLAYYFLGMFTNLFVPGLVGGDAARALYLGRRSGRTAQAIASVIADRGIGLLALFWLAAGCALLTHHAGVPPAVIIATVAVGAAALALYLAAPLAARLIIWMPSRLRTTGEVVLPYLRHRVAIAPAIVLSLILQISLAFCQYLLALGLNLDVTLSLLLLIVPITNVFASIPVTLNGLGIRETSYLLLLGSAGVSRTDAITLGLLWFAATMTGGLFGGISFVITDLPAPLPLSTDALIGGDDQP